MKKLVTIVAFLCAVALSIPGRSIAQGIVINSISQSSFCSGDPVTVSFTIDASWGPKNAFTLQLSDSAGNFTSPVKSLGSIQDVAAGTISIVSTLPTTVTSSAHYRFKIQGAGAFTTSTLNASDIYIGQSVSPLVNVFAPSVAVLGKPITFEVVPNGFDGKDDSMYWDFGSDATPATLACINSENIAPSVSYDSIGTKTVTLRVQVPGGCSKSVSFDVTVFGYSAPRIHSNALVISQTTSGDYSRKALWVNPGVSLTVKTVGGWDTIYAEAGASVAADGKHVIYLKKGATLTGTGGSIVIYEPGANLDSAKNMVLADASLKYDYTNAPSNPTVTGAVSIDPAFASIALSPNPTQGVLEVTAIPSGVKEITIINLLGETVLTYTPHSSIASLNLSRFAAGTYYVRIASQNGIATKRIVKE